MDFNCWDLGRFYCIPYCIGIVRIGSCIDYHAVYLAHCRLYYVDYLTLMIGLNTEKLGVAALDVGIKLCNDA